MLGKKFRKKIDVIAPKVAKPIARLNIHPNIISLVGIPLALLSAYFVLNQQWLYAAFMLAIASSMDLIDGAVARLSGKASYFGNYFETMIDKYIEVIVLSSIAFHFPEGALAIGLALIESYAKPRVALVIITDNRDWPAIGEHADRLLTLIFGMLLAVFIPEIANIATVRLALWLLIVMTLVGGIQRIMYAKKLIEEAEKKGKILPYLKKGYAHEEVE